MTTDDIKVIIASARKIITDANNLPDSKRHDFIVEAATIIRLCESFVRAVPVAASNSDFDIASAG